MRALLLAIVIVTAGCHDVVAPRHCTGTAVIHKAGEFHPDTADVDLTCRK